MKIEIDLLAGDAELLDQAIQEPFMNRMVPAAGEGLKPDVYAILDAYIILQNAARKSIEESKGR